MENLLEINDYDELLALHRALLELKTITQPNDEAVIGSTFVAHITHRVVDSIIEYEKHSGNEERARSWVSWRSIDESRREWGLILKQIESAENWGGMTLQQKKEYVANIASPFILSDRQTTTFVDYGDDLQP